LLALTLLPTAPIFAVGPPQKGEEKTVSFTGYLTGSGILTVERKRKGLVVYGPIDLNFSNKFGTFEGPHYGGLRITIKDGDASLPGYGFDWYTWVDQWGDEHRVPKYYLEGSGTTSLVDETYTINLDASIYDVVPHREGKGKKGAIGLEFVGPVWSGDIIFTMTIEWDT